MISPRDLEWAAGFLEGEGSFRAHGGVTASVQASQVQREPLERLRLLFGGHMYQAPAKGNRAACWKWTLAGIAGAGLMFTLYGLLSTRRREQIRDSLRPWRSAPAGNQYRPTCAQGHPYSGDNLKRWGANKNYRWCLECSRERNRGRRSDPRARRSESSAQAARNRRQRDTVEGLLLTGIACIREDVSRMSVRYKPGYKTRGYRLQ